MLTLLIVLALAAVMGVVVLRMSVVEDHKPATKPLRRHRADEPARVAEAAAPAGRPRTPGRAQRRRLARVEPLPGPSVFEPVLEAADTPFRRRLLSSVELLVIVVVVGVLAAAVIGVVVVLVGSLLNAAIS